MYTIDSIKRDFADIGTTRQLKSHYTLVNQGDKVNKIYLVLSGGLILLHVHPITGVERAINFFIPDFHPIASVAEHYYLQTPSIYRLKTFTNSTVIELDRAAVDEYISTSNQLLFFQDYGIRTLLEKNTLRTLLISLNSEEMLQHLHQHHPQILQQVPSKYVADFLGITPQWLSKLKHKLR